MEISRWTIWAERIWLTIRALLARQRPLMPAGADPRKHHLKPSRTWRPGWVFAVGLSLLVHVGLLKVFSWVDGGAHGRGATSSAQQPRVIHAQLLTVPVPAAQKEVVKPWPPKSKAAAPLLPPEQAQ